jgi:hypothetical protein
MKAVELQLLLLVNVWFLGPSQKEKPDKRGFPKTSAFGKAALNLRGKAGC